jgi:hypothetical protein
VVFVAVVASLVAIEESDVLPVVWFAAVATPVVFVAIVDRYPEIAVRVVFAAVWRAAVAAEPSVDRIEPSVVLPVVWSDAVAPPPPDEPAIVVSSATAEVNAVSAAASVTGNGLAAPATPPSNRRYS